MMLIKCASNDNYSYVVEMEKNKIKFITLVSHNLCGRCRVLHEKSLFFIFILFKSKTIDHCKYAKLRQSWEGDF